MLYYMCMCVCVYLLLLLKLIDWLEKDLKLIFFILQFFEYV